MADITELRHRIKSVQDTHQITKAMEQGVIFINAGANTLRFVPPLIIEKEHVDEMIHVLEGLIKEL